MLENLIAKKNRSVRGLQTYHFTYERHNQRKQEYLVLFRYYSDALNNVKRKAFLGYRGEDLVGGALYYSLVKYIILGRKMLRKPASAI